MTSQFHEILKFVLLRNFAFWPDCASELSDLTIFSSSNERADSHNFRFCSLQALEMQNLSNCCKHKYDQSISRVFKIWFLAGFCCLDRLCPCTPSSSAGPAPAVKPACAIQWNGKLTSKCHWTTVLPIPIQKIRPNTCKTRKSTQLINVTCTVQRGVMYIWSVCLKS